MNLNILPEIIQHLKTFPHYVTTDSFSFHVLIITILLLAYFHLRSTLLSTLLPGIT